MTGKTTLEPGVYCGGINVIGGDVTLKPGTYILNNGGLVVSNGGKLSGENVGFYLTGALGLSTIQFAPSTTISLTAPKTGDMAGMLFFEDRDVLFKFPHIIASNNARNLVGTIYLPGNTLEINSQDPIADQSDYTVIIARKFDMKDGPELVLNTDYENSLIPVPGRRRQQGAAHRPAAPGRVGLTFAISLALCRRVMRSDAFPTGLRPMSYKHALLVDDDPVFRALTEDMVLDAGVGTVDMAEDGLDALAKLDAGLTPDLLVCDLNMPAHDGVSLIRSLSDRKFPGKVLIISGEAPAVIDTVAKLAKMQGLDIIGSIRKPLTTRSAQRRPRRAARLPSAPARPAASRRPSLPCSTPPSSAAR